jgi:hypothetical protein
MMTVGIGTKFYSAFADGCPEYTVIQKKGQGIWLCRIEEDVDWTGHEALFSTREIKAKLSWDSMLSGLADDHESFYANLEDGQIVHYHNAFGRYVRCRVVNHELLPIALLGPWPAHDLPRRDLKGSLIYPYYVKKIMEGETMTPNFSNIYEAKPHNMKGDPTTMEPIDLSVPELTDDEQVVANRWKQVQKARDILDNMNREEDPREILREVQKATMEVI